MKNFTKMSLLTMVFLFSSLAIFAQSKSGAEPTQVPDQIEVGKAGGFTVTLWDSYGDGWNGASIDVLVNGVVVLDDISAPDDGNVGNIPHDFTFNAAVGDVVSTTFVSGAWNSEITYAFYTEAGFLITASGAGTVSFPIEANIALNPTDLSLGMWAVGAWQESQSIELESTGNVPVEIRASEMEDPAEAFTMTDLTDDVLNPGATTEVGFSFSGAVAGMFEATYVASFGEVRSVATARIAVDAYDALEGDVKEDPIEIAAFPYMNAASVASMESNYNTPVDPATKDMVYKFELATDSKISVTSTNVDAKFAIYTEDFGGKPGPMATNELLKGVIDQENILNGVYFLVVSCDTDYDLDVITVDQPAPMAAFNGDTDPAAVGGTVNPADVDLVWEVGANASEYQLLFGTDVPPTTIVQDFTDIATMYTVGALDNTTQYFWQVNLKNTQGVTEGPIWFFTTDIAVPTNFTATIVDETSFDDMNDVVLAWDALDGALGYYVYIDGVSLNGDVMLTANTYTDMDRASNECLGNPGYVYSVTAEFAEGVSEMADAAPVSINGVGTVEGKVTQLLLPNDPIAGAMVTLTSTTGGEDYEFTTNVTGDYTGDVFRDTYTYSVEATDYSTESLGATVVVCGANAAVDFQLDEFPYAVESVTATEQANETDVLVEWVYAAKAVEKFMIYRQDCGGGNQVFLGEVISGSQFLDQTWGDVTAYGTYEWVVEVVYTSAGNVASKSSNCLDKNMEAVVDVTVTTNSDDLVMGCLVKFMPHDITTDYDTVSIILDATGTQDDIVLRKGMYDIKVVLDGFATIDDLNILIDEDMSFVWELIEILEAPSNLYVTPLGYATWVDPNAVVDMDIFPNEPFDGTALPAGWTMNSVNTVGWQVSAGNGGGSWYKPQNGAGVDGSYAWCDDDSQPSTGPTEDTLFSPSFSLEGAFEATLTFSHYYPQTWGSICNAYVSIDGGATWMDVFAPAGTDAAWQDESLDLTPYVGEADVRFAFRMFDNGAWGYGWAIDNFEITGRGVGAAKQFLGYRTWHDGVFAADVNAANYQYGTNPDNILVSGDTYTAEVANEYSSGFSAHIMYDWTFVPCDSFPGNANLMAAYVAGTTDNLISWDALDADLTVGTQTFEILGTNIYRDGEMLMFVELGTSEYTDAAMTPGTYEYCTEVVYTLDGGTHKWESCSVNCVSDVVVPEDIFGQVAGNVSDIIGPMALEGATVTLTNDVNTHMFTTDADGNYAGDAVIGTYTYTASAAGFISEERAAVIVAYGATATEDFLLYETPYPVGNVHAEEMDENTVKVTWGEVPAEGWLMRDDGVMAFGGAGGLDVPYNYQFAIIFTPDMLEDYLTSGFITKFSLAQIARIPLVSEFRIYQDDVLLYTQDILDDFPYDNSTVEVMLDEAVAFDATKDLWITVYQEHAGEEFNAPLALATDFVSGMSDIFSVNGADYTSVEEMFGAAGYSFMLRAYANTASGAKSVALGNVEIPKGKYKDYTGRSGNSLGLQGAIDAETYEANILALKQSTTPTVQLGSKALQGYNIYRLPCDMDAVSDEYLIGYTVDEFMFTDNSWGTADWGMYQWAVQAVYTNNTSEAAFSVECLDKEMETLVNLVVTTNSGDSPGGTSVVFSNTIETELEDISVTMPGSGTKTVDPFRKGTYDIVVSKTGYETIEVMGAVIHEETTFTWELIEKFDAANDLYVTPTGYATWSGTSVQPFVPFLEAFDDGVLPDGWTMTTNSAIGWFITTDGSSGFWPIPAGDGAYACSNDDAADDDGSMDMLMLPVQDFTSNAAPFLTFSTYFTAQYSQTASVLVSTDGVTYTSVFEGEAVTDWSEVSVNLIDYAGEAMVYIAFHANDNGAWASGWAVDNVAVTEGDAKGVEDFLVYHDGAFSGSTIEEFYQYGVNETLVEGETYMAEVVTVFSTGNSEPVSYEWTYLSCANFPNWVSMDANVYGNDDVLVRWSDYTLPNIVLYENDFDAYTSGDYLAVVDSENWTTWSNAPGSAEDGMITDAFAQTAPNAVMISGTNDNVFPLGDKTSGAYEILFDLYVPTDRVGYFNIQTITLSEWTMSLTFELDGTITVSAGGQAPTGNTFTPDTWMEVHVVADVDADVATVSIDGVELVEWQISLTETGLAGTAQLGCVNMYAHTGTVAGTPEYYFDNFRYEEQPADKSAKELATFGTNVYRDGEMIAFVPAPDTFLLDMDLMPGYYDYCVERVNTDDEGLHTWVCASDCSEVLVPEECIIPENLTAEDLLGDGYTATLNWQLALPGEEFFEGFESGTTPDGWLSLDEDGDGNIWQSTNVDGFGFDIYEGDHCMTSASYINGVGALNPDNWLISPAIAIGATSELSFWVDAQDANYADEVFYVKISTTGTAVEDFNFTIYDGVSPADWAQISIDVSAFAGENLYFAIQHTDCSDMFYLKVDNFAVTNSETRAAFTAPVANNTSNGMPFRTSEMSQDQIDAAFATYNENQESVITAIEGTNIYRDGEMIAFVPAPATTYQDVFDEAGEHCYTVTATYEFCGESEESNIACVDVGVGVNNLENNISIYPNPATDFVMVEANSNIRSIVVTNYMGQVVNSIKAVEMTQKSIDTSSLSAGVYFVEVETEAGIEKVRIIISK